MKDGTNLGGEERKAANTSPAETAAVVTDRIAKKGLHGVQKNTSRLKRLEVEYVELESVKPNTYNPNRQNEQTLELLCRSMQEDGFTQPIVVHAQSREIVDGEHRWRAAQKLGMSQVPVVFVEMTDEQMRIATLRHNRARGTEDVELATDVLRDLQQLGAIDWAQGSLMLSDGEMNELLDKLPAPEALAGDDYSEAWVPERGGSEQVEIAETGSTKTVVTEVEGSDGGRNAVAMTRAAAQEHRDRQAEIDAAPTQEAKMQIVQKSARPFRLQCTFTGVEAETVMSVLGEESAEKLLEICRQRDPGPDAGSSVPAA